MDEMVQTEITKNLQEELNLEIFKMVSLEKNLDPKEVRGTEVVREFVPKYMKEDICNRPKRNERPLGWYNSGGLEEDGLGSASGPKNSPNGGSDTGGKFGGSGSDSNVFLDNTMTDETEEDGGIFAKCLGWLGCCLGAPSPNSYYDSSTMSKCGYLESTFGGTCKEIQIGDIHIIVFSNSCPDLSVLSVDRWRLWTLSGADYGNVIWPVAVSPCIKTINTRNWNIV